MNLASKYLNPKNDLAFKQIFGEKKNKDILIAMLNVVLKNQLHKPIKKVEFLKTSQDPKVAVEKQSIVDVLCQDQDGCRYIIEMQISGRKNFEKRAQYYAAKTYSSQLNPGAPYHELKAVIFLAFTSYQVFPDNPHYKNEHVILNTRTNKQELKDFSFTFVELPKFAKQLTKPINELTLEEKFYYFLDKAPSMTPDDLKKLVGKDIIIQKAFDVLNSFHWTPEQIATYDKIEKNERDYLNSMQGTREEGREEGIKEGEEKGRKKGIEEGMKKGEEKGRKKGIEEGMKKGEEKGKKERDREIVGAMLAKGLKLQEIADLTGINVEEVEKGMQK